MKKIFLIPTLVLFVSACTSSEKSTIDTEYGAVEMVEYAMQEDMAETETVLADDIAPVAVSPRKVVRDGNMGFKVDDIKRGKAMVDALVTQYEAYYGNESYQEYTARLEYDLMIRVPSQSFDNFVKAIEAADGNVDYKNIVTRDVSEQYYDLEVRLENKRSYLARYRDLLQRATKIEEILEVETSIRALEEEIESAEGRLRLLSSQIDYSTLTLTLYQDRAIVAKSTQNFWHKVRNALVGGWSGFAAVVVALLYLWPLAFGALVVLGIILVVQKSKKKKQA